MTTAQRRARKYFLQLLRILDRLAPRERDRVIAALNRAYAAVSLDQLEAALRSGSEAALMRAMGVGTVSVELRSAMLRTLPRVVSRVGPLAADELAVLIDAPVNWSTLQARAIRWTRQRAATMVVAIERDARDAIRKALDDALAQDLRIGALAKRLREHVGLDPRFSKALSGYQDRVAIRVARGDISAARGDQLAGIYRRRLVRFRSESIARTEINRAINATQLNVWQEAANRGLYDADEWVKEWIGILRDGRICKHCYRLHGQRRRVSEAFVAPTDGEVLQTPGKHTRCRCQMRQARVREPAESMPPFVEPKKGRGLAPMIAPRRAAQAA